jgi:MFS family permease
MSEVTSDQIPPVEENSELTPSRLMNKDFFLLWQGQLVSQIGSQAFLLGMMYWTMEATGSGSLMGVLMMLTVLPAVLLGPLGGTLADRYSRKFIIVICDVLSGIAMLALTGLFLLESASTELLIACLVLVATCVGVVQAFFRPAIMAAIPDLVPPPKISAANSLNQFSYQFSSVMGQGTGGVVYSFLGAPLLFLIDGVTFLFSALSESFIQIPQKPAEKSVNTKEALKSFHRDMMYGLRYVWRWIGMRDFLIMIGLVHFFAMPFIVLMPFYVELRLGEGADWYGFLMAGFSGGSVTGYVFAGAFSLAGQMRSRLSLILLSVASILYGLLGVVNQPYVALIVVFLSGAMLGIFNVNMMTIIQTSVTSELRGRVMGLVMTIANAASPLGMVAGGVAADLTGKNVPLIYAICGGAIVVSVLLLGSRQPVLHFLAGSGNRNQ